MVNAPSNMCASSSFVYWRGLIDPQNILNYTVVASKIFNLLQNKQTNGANLEKLHGHDIYSIRTSKKGRVLFTDYLKDGKKYLLLLEYLPNHEYDKSKFLKSGVLEAFRSKNCDANEHCLDWTTINVDDLTQLDLSSCETNYMPFPLDYFNSTVISFNTQQGEALQQQLPSLISGPPGSGKTCVALSSITNYVGDTSSQDGKSVVYVCISENLARTMERNWNSQPASSLVGTTQVKFMSYEALINELSPGKAKVTEEETLSWLQRNIPRKSTLDNNKLFEEFQILSPYTWDEYLERGERQCLFHDESEKRQVFDLFQAYKTWLSEEGKYDIRFKTSEHDEDRYDYIVVDEAQDFSPSALLHLYTLANGNVSYFMDTQQDLEDSLSKRIHLKQLMYSKGIELHSCHLPTVYRCPTNVLKLANRWLGIKAFIVGGTSDKEEYREIQIENGPSLEQGSINWEVDGVANTYERLRFIHSEVEFAIVVPTEASKLDDELESFGRHLLFTPEEIKGLEFPVVFLYKPFELAEFKEVNKRLKDVEEDDLVGNRNRPKNHGANDSSALPLIPEMRKIFTTLTRAEDTLIIYQPVNRSVYNIHRLLEPIISQAYRELDSDAGGSSSSSPPEQVSTSEEEWLTLAKRYLKNGLRDKFQEICLKLGESPKAVEARLSGIQQEPCAGSSNSNLDGVRNSGKTSKAAAKKRKKKAKKKKKTKRDPMVINLDNLQKEVQLINTQEDLNKFLSTYDINCKSTDGCLTPLMCAVLSKPIEIVQMLIENGANVNALDCEGSSAFFFAAMNGETDKAKLLLESGVDSNKHKAMMFAIVYDGLEEIVSLLIEVGYPVDEILRSRMTPPTGFPEPGRDEILRSRMTPLMLATKKERDEILRLLLCAGADPNKVKYGNETALMIAAQEGNKEIVRILLGWEGIDIEKASDSGDTALIIACRKGNKEIVEMFIEAGANINAKNIEGDTPLIIACRIGNKEIVEAMIREGADLEATTTLDGITALMTAAWGDLGIVKMLLEAGADISKENIEGYTALQLAASAGERAIVEEILAETVKRSST